MYLTRVWYFCVFRIELFTISINIFVLFTDYLSKIIYLIRLNKQIRKILDTWRHAFFQWRHCNCTVIFVVMSSLWYKEDTYISLSNTFIGIYSIIYSKNVVLCCVEVFSIHINFIFCKHKHKNSVISKYVSNFCLVLWYVFLDKIVQYFKVIL